MTDRSRLRRVLDDPLLHFVVIGTLLAAAGAWFQRNHDVYRIVVTPAHVSQLVRKYQLQFGAPPSEAILRQLVDDDIHDEILFRQGMATGLDRDDEIIRRRVVQKEQFLLQDTRAPAEPSEKQLADYFAAHADRYAAASQASFSHIYFAVASAGQPKLEAAARERATAALAHIPAGATRDPDLGDPFPDLYDFSAFEPEQAERLFGRTPFSAGVFSAPVGHWSGPYRSAYGWHLLYVNARTPAHQATLAEVHDRVRTDALQDAQDRTNRESFDRVAKRFTVVRQDKGGGR